MSTSTVISLPYYKLGTLAVHTGHKPLRVLLHTHTQAHTHDILWKTISDKVQRHI